MCRLFADVHAEGKQGNRAVQEALRDGARPLSPGAAELRFLLARQPRLQEVPRGEQPRKHVHGGPG